jgi:hypothetical protein
MKFPCNYNNFYILYYPQYAGGNFLGAVLGLDQQTVFHNKCLIRDQLDNKFDYYAKKQYLLNQINEAYENKVWKDFVLGPLQTFEFSIYDEHNEPDEIISLRLPRELDDVVNRNLRMFMICHSPNHIKRCLDLWPNAKIIVFTNYQSFVEKRKNKSQSPFKEKLKNYWKTIRADLWPEHPPTTQEEFISLDQKIQQECLDLFRGEILRYLDYSDYEYSLWHEEAKNICSNSNNYCIDIGYAYLNFENFYETYRDICTKYNFVSAEKNDVQEIFECWMSKIVLRSVKLN